MSEGVHHGCASVGDFWARRMHYVVDALVACGITRVDAAEYEELKGNLMHHGLREPEAALLALETLAGNVRDPSACEVNPW